MNNTSDSNVLGVNKSKNNAKKCKDKNCDKNSVKKVRTLTNFRPSDYFDLEADEEDKKIDETNREYYDDKNSDDSNFIVSSEEDSEEAEEESRRVKDGSGDILRYHVL